jgi:hypothetical protein
MEIAKKRLADAACLANRNSSSYIDEILSLFAIQVKSAASHLFFFL